LGKKFCSITQAQDTQSGLRTTPEECADWSEPKKSPWGVEERGYRKKRVANMSCEGEEKLSAF